MKDLYLNLWHWFRVSVWIVGIPHVAYYSYLGLTSATFTTTCMTVGYKCESKTQTPPSKVIVNADALSAYQDGFRDGGGK